MNNNTTFGKIIMSKNIESSIDFIHSHIEDAIEWSGILFYKYVSGSLKDKNLKYIAVDLYLMNIGNQAYTSYLFENCLPNAYNCIDPDLKCQIGMIHSHHNMNTSFSSTDMDELIENGKKYNHYISVIVNYRKNYSAKILYPLKSKVKKTHKYLDSNGKERTFIDVYTDNNDKIIGNLNVIIDKNCKNDKWFTDRYNEIMSIYNRDKTNYPSFMNRQSLFDNCEYMNYRQNTFMPNSNMQKSYLGNIVKQNNTKQNNTKQKSNLKDIVIQDNNVIDDFIKEILLSDTDDVKICLQKYFEFDESYFEEIFDTTIKRILETYCKNSNDYDKIIRSAINRIKQLCNEMNIKDEYEIEKIKFLIELLEETIELYCEDVNDKYIENY